MIASLVKNMNFENKSFPKILINLSSLDYTMNAWLPVYWKPSTILISNIIF